ncbi:MAG: GNAT family N-acetyltransferase [Thomasclavelia sp.]|jgi:predicted acetyltransferase|nr:GNAT family N-acetyltransferase [Thomasclavelia sp.]
MKKIHLKLLQYLNKDLAPGFSPYYIYLIYLGSEVVGKIVLREGSCEERYFDGHIGYSIYYEHRGHNYAYLACLELLKIAKEKGFKELIITCSPGNIASLKTIEKLPSSFIEKKSIPSQIKKLFFEDENEKLIYKIKLEDL